MVSGQPAVVSKGQVWEGRGAVCWYRPEMLMHGPLAHQAEHLPFKPFLTTKPIYFQPLRQPHTSPKDPKDGQDTDSS
jgi:hypothetical protein